MGIYGSDEGWFWKKALSSHLVTVAVNLSIYNCLIICICHMFFSLALVLNFRGVHWIWHTCFFIWLHLWLSGVNVSKSSNNLKRWRYLNNWNENSNNKTHQTVFNNAFLDNDSLCRYHSPQHSAERHCWEKPCADGGSFQEVVLTIATVGITYL